MRTRTLDTLSLADRLRPVLLRIARELRREAQAETGVSPGQIALLATIKYEPGISLGELAGRERMSAPAMTRYIDRLENAGLVTRTPSSDDGRDPAPQRAHVHEPEALAQLPAVLLRPDHLGHRHVDAADRAGMADPAAHTQLGGRRRLHGVRTVPPVHHLRPLRRDVRRPDRRAPHRDRHADGS